MKQPCKSCGREFEGCYCHYCGEKRLEQKDRTLRHFLMQLISAITFADSKMWRSILILIRKPGQFSSDYAEGIRKPYMTPVGLFFLANFLYFLFPFFNTFTTNLDIQTQMWLYGNKAETMVIEKVERMDVNYETFERSYNIQTTSLSKLLLILMVLLFSIPVALIHWDFRRLFADYFLVSFEFLSFILLYAIMALSLITISLSWLLKNLHISSEFLLSDRFLTPTVTALSLYFLGRAERVFFKASLLRAVFNSLLLLISFWITVMFYRYILFLVTMAKL
jgi:hypothetical protein